MVEIKMSEDEDYTELFEKIIGVYGEFRLQCDSHYRERVFDHSHRLIRKYGGPNHVSEMRLLGFEQYAEDTKESHEFVMKMVDVFGGELFIGESYDAKTVVHMVNSALERKGFNGVTELQLIGIREIMDGEMDDVVFGRVPPIVQAEQRYKRFKELMDNNDESIMK